MTGSNVSVGFQTAHMKVDLQTAGDLSKLQLNALIDAAERSCVILQSPRAPPIVEIERSFGDLGNMGTTWAQDKVSLAANLWS